MAKPKLVCFIGDMHVGSKTSVAKKFELADGDMYTPSLHQDWLMQCFDKFSSKVKVLSKSHDVYLMLGGDLTDGVAHHGTTQTFGDSEDQTSLAVDILLPLAGVSHSIYALLGTSSHTGQSGHYDKQVAKELGAKKGNIDYRHLINFDGRLLDWAHHTTAGRRVHTRGNSLKHTATDIYFSSLEDHRPTPNLIVRHHVHIADDIQDSRRGWRAVTCASWQLHTEYTRSLQPHSLPDIGGMLWWPGENKIEHVLYRPEGDRVKNA